MKTEKEIQKRIEEIVNMINDEENQQEIVQAKLYAELDILKWILR